jgi:hypothetical protein
MNTIKIESPSQWDLDDLFRTTLRDFEALRNNPQAVLDRFLNRLPPGTYSFDPEANKWRVTK